MYVCIHMCRYMHTYTYTYVHHAPERFLERDEVVEELLWENAKV